MARPVNEVFTSCNSYRIIYRSLHLSHTVIVSSHQAMPFTTLTAHIGATTVETGGGTGPSQLLTWGTVKHEQLAVCHTL